MEVIVNTKMVCKMDIQPEEALNILCKTLDMEFVLDEDRKFYISDDGSVWETVNGHDCEIDERGDLFIALRNVMVNMFPNLYFRSDPYIYSRE